MDDGPPDFACLPFEGGGVPVITANFWPLRFVIRDDADAWNPTIEQINRRDYDYVKLHRVSCMIDIGIKPLSIAVCYDGTLVLPHTSDYHDLNVALSQFNQTVTEILFGGIYCEAVSPEDVGFGTMSFSAYVRMLNGGQGPAITFHRAARYKYIGELEVIKLFKLSSINTTDLQSAITKGREILAKIGKIPQEQLLYGVTFFVRKQWAEALIHLWTTTERIVELAWQKHVIEKSPTLTKKRRSFLEDYRTWTASSKLEVLFQKGLLPFEVHTTLDEVRKARNDFAHKGIVPSYDTCVKAVTGCFQIASLCGTDFVDSSQFDATIQMIVDSRMSVYKAHEKLERGEISPTHWLSIPPIPGEKEWGDKPFEVIEDLVLKPLPREQPPHDSSDRMPPSTTPEAIIPLEADPDENQKGEIKEIDGHKYHIAPLSPGVKNDPTQGREWTDEDGNRYVIVPVKPKERRYDADGRKDNNVVD